MSAVATETTCLGLTSMYSIWLGRASGNVSRKRDGTRSAVKWPCSSSGAFAWATTCCSSSSAGRYSISSVTTGRTGNASAFCFLSSAAAASVKARPALRTTVPSLCQQVRARLEGLEGGVVPGDRPLDLAVGRLDEAVAVDPAVRGERADEADVRPFGRLDRADPAVVAVVDVADVEAGPLARQATRPEGRQAPLRGELGQRVRLVHELAELAAAEELLHRGHDRPDVDERVGRRLVDLLDRHPLADDPLHPQQADPERVLDELAVGPDAPVAEVVDVVLGVEAAVALDEVADDGRDVFLADRAPVAGQLDAHPPGDPVELLVELVAADPPEVVAPEVEEEALDQLAGVVAGGRIARPELLVDLDQGVLLGVGQVLVEGARDVRMVGVRVDRRRRAR